MSTPRFDLDTGAEEFDRIEQMAEQAAVMSLAEAREIVRMTETRGWAILAEFIQGSIEMNKNRLVSEVDPDKVRRLQERTQAFLQVLGLVSHRVSEASAQAQELSTEENEEQPDPGSDPDNQE